MTRLDKNIILESKTVSEYIKSIGNEGTETQYKVRLTDFFSWININPDDYIKDPRKLRIQDPLSEIEYLDKIEKDIFDYNKSFDTRTSELTKRLFSPNSRKNRIHTIKNLLEWNHIELSKKFWIDFRRKNKSPTVVIDDISPTQEQMQKLVEIGDIREKCVITCQTSSGTRIGELLDIRLKDLKWDDYKRYGVLLVEIRANNIGNKTSKTRITFFSEEAIRYLKIWLDTENSGRDKYLKRARQKAKNLQKSGYMKGQVKNDDRVFPFSTNTWRDNSWNKLLRHTDMDWKDDIGHYRFRTHSLRKYFKKMGSKYNDALRDQLIGHKGFEQRYSDITDKDEFCNEIKKLEPYVTIFNYEDGQTREKVERQEKEIEIIIEENKDLKQTMHMQKQQIEAMQKALKKITDNIGEELTEKIERKKALENEPTIAQTVRTKDGRKFTNSQRV